jgi:hypothetical protein
MDPTMATFSEPSAAVHCATIVVGNAVTKLEGLMIVALVADAEVRYQRTARPYVPIAEGCWAEIEIPKFGEPPPLAIDVYSSVSGDHARLHALSLLEGLRTQTAWNLRPDFPV